MRCLKPKRVSELTRMACIPLEAIRNAVTIQMPLGILGPFSAVGTRKPTTETGRNPCRKSMISSAGILKYEAV
ncbi:hypothetical protein D3C81_1963210 [compost metagenome]